MNRIGQAEPAINRHKVVLWPRSHPSVNHLSLKAEDIEETGRHLEKVGIPLEAPRSDKRGLERDRGMWIVDPDGNRIEIMEMAPDCLQWEAIAAMRAGKPPSAVMAPRRHRKGQGKVSPAGPSACATGSGWR